MSEEQVSSFIGWSPSETVSFLISGMEDRFNMTSGWMSDWSLYPSDYYDNLFIPIGYFRAMRFKEMHNDFYYEHTTQTWTRPDYITLMYGNQDSQPNRQAQWNAGYYCNNGYYYSDFYDLIRGMAISIAYTFATPQSPISGSRPWNVRAGGSYLDCYVRYWEANHPGVSSCLSTYLNQTAYNTYRPYPMDDARPYEELAIAINDALSTIYRVWWKDEDDYSHSYWTYSQLAEPTWHFYGERNNEPNDNQHNDS